MKPAPQPASLQNKYYPECRFGGFTQHDGTVAFYTRVNALLDPRSVIVDFGCGRGAVVDDPVRFRRQVRDLRAAGRTVIGVDVDPMGGGNPFLNEFRLLSTDGTWPLDSASADLVVTDCVLEHLLAPEFFFAQAARVLKPGGYICIRTPNSASYVGLISRLVPPRLHQAVLKKAQPGRREEDVFPAVYRCNSVWRLRGMLEKHGFDAVVYGHGAEPGYLDFSRWAYLLGVFYQKYAPVWMRPSLFAFGQLHLR
ncbi:MAG TPA: class I SAM-dependent methyltransferase [Bryobacteraceae bacterium]|nr:class I SAM-dependent methyltransferase [Bryobacteraceae bacterium]